MAQVRLPELLRENTKIREENESLKELLSEIQDWMLDNDYECGCVGASLYEKIEKHLSK
jgi:regulator of replication initiation timing